MPFSIPDAVMKEFRLDKTDKRMGVPKAEATMVTVKQATVGDNARRADLFSEYTQEIKHNDDAPDRLIFRFPLYQLMAKEVFLTLVGCNITIGAKGEEKPLFNFGNGPNGPFLDMKENEFNTAWGAITDDNIAIEIHEKVLEMNPHWILGNDNSDLGKAS